MMSDTSNHDLSCYPSSLKHRCYAQLNGTTKGNMHEDEGLVTEWSQFSKLAHEVMEDH